MRFLLPTLLTLAACSSSPPLRPYVPNSAPRAVVRLDANDRSAVLEGRFPGFGEFVPMSAAPCGKALPTELEWRVNGPGISPSKPFSIAGPTTLRAFTASRVAVDLLGVPLVVLGAGVATFGDFAIGIFEAQSDDSLARRREVSAAVFGVGALFVTFGIVVLNTPTKVVAAPIARASTLRLTRDGVAFAF